MKLKRLLPALLGLCLFVCLLAGTAAAAETVDSGTCGDNAVWVLTDDGTLTISGTGPMTDYDGNDIGPWGEAHAEVIKTVIIDDGITYIGSRAFRNCGMTAVTIPDSVTGIGRAAFSYCEMLESVVIPDSVTELGSYLFTHCSALKEVKLPAGISVLPDFTFSNCTSLVSAAIPENVTAIGSSAFTGCDALITVTAGDRIEVVMNGAFLNCTSLKSVELGDGLIEISMAAFRGCTALETVTFGDKLEAVGENGFVSCASLKEIDLGESLQQIGTTAFGGCKSLQSLVIPDSMNTIGTKAFAECTGLTYLDLGDGVQTVRSNAFTGCTGLTSLTISDSLTTYFMGGVFSGCTGLKTVTVGNSLQKLSDGMFLNCTALESVTIGKSISVIHEYAFENATALKEIHFLGSAPSMDDAFEGITATAYYPGNDATWTREVMDSVAGTITWESVTVAPDAPVVTGANVASSGKIKLTWNAVEGAASYRIYRATSKSGPWKLMKTTTGTTYTNTSAAAGTTYYYYVAALAGDGTPSQPSNTVTRTCDLPRPVVSISNVASSGKIKLTWEAVEGAVKYQVYRATSKDGSYTLMKTTTGTTYTNTSAKAGTTYYYKVKAVAEKSAANSAYSSYKSRTCDLPRPVVSIALKSGKPRLTWAAIDGAVSYKIYRATVKDGPYKLMKTTTGTSYTNTSAKSGTTYYYKVVAVHTRSAANSAYSLVDSIKAK